MPTDSTFTPAQEKVLALLSAGHTAVAAAAAASVHRNTVSNWLRLPAFRQALAHIQYQKALQWREKAEALLPDAFDTIQRIMVDPRAPAGVRLKAALSLVGIAASPLPAHPDDVQKSAPAVHNDAQPAGRLPELQPAPEPKPEPAPVHNPAQSAPARPGHSPFAGPLHNMHNPAQPPAGTPSEPITYESLREMARTTLAQLRPDLLKEIEARRK